MGAILYSSQNERPPLSYQVLVNKSLPQAFALCSHKLYFSLEKSSLLYGFFFNIRYSLLHILEVYAHEYQRERERYGA